MQCKTSGSSVFSNFFYEVRYHKVKEVTDPGFSKKVQMGTEGSKSPKNGLKLRFLGFQWSLNFLQNKILGKNLVLQSWSKNLMTNQNAGFSKL